MRIDSKTNEPDPFGDTCIQQDRPETRTETGTVIGNPSPGENRSGKRNCTFVLETNDGRQLVIYSVRYRDDCMKLVIGDKVKVTFVRNDKFNNLVSAPEILEEGDKIDRIMSAVENLDKMYSSIAKQNSAMSLQMMEIRKELKELSGQVAALRKDLFEDEQGLCGPRGAQASVDQFVLGNPLVDPHAETIGGP